MEGMTWELINEENDETYRMKLPNGFLYKVTNYADNPSIAICFVPDSPK